MTSVDSLAATVVGRHSSEFDLPEKEPVKRTSTIPPPIPEEARKTPTLDRIANTYTARMMSVLTAWHGPEVYETRTEGNKRFITTTELVEDYPASRRQRLVARWRRETPLKPEQMTQSVIMVSESSFDIPVTIALTYLSRRLSDEQYSDMLDVINAVTEEFDHACKPHIIDHYRNIKKYVNRP